MAASALGIYFAHTSTPNVFFFLPRLTHEVDRPVIGYFVYYSRRSSGQPGSCTYDSSMYVNSPSATVPNLDPHTIYYFAVSAYNGLESPCSEEISTITSSPVI